MNEVLDAIPPHLISRRNDGWFERGVAFAESLRWDDRPLADESLRAAAIERFPKTGDYMSEINPAAEALVADVGRRMTAGALLTFVLFRTAPQSLWMLPGLWQLIFSLGFLASCRSLPKPMFAVGVWYLACGLACLAFASGEHALSSWAMALPIGIGQLMMAAILYWGMGDTNHEVGVAEQ